MPKCGECLMAHLDIVELRKDGGCDCCDSDHKIIQLEQETFERQPLPKVIKGRKIKTR